MREIVSVDSLPQIRSLQFTHDFQPPLPHMLGEIEPFHLFLRSVKVAYRRHTLEHTRAVFVSPQETGPLQPGDRGLDLGARRVRALIERYFGIRHPKQLTRGNHYFLRVATSRAADRAEDLGNVPLCQAVIRCEVELRLKIALGKQQDAVRGLAVPSRSACLLQVILDGARDVGVHDQAYVCPCQCPCRTRWSPQ